MILNENQIEILLETEFLLNESTVKSYMTGSDFNYAKKLNEVIDKVETEKQKEKIIKKIEKALDEVEYFIKTPEKNDTSKEAYRRHIAGQTNLLKIGAGTIPFIAALTAVFSVPWYVSSISVPVIADIIRHRFKKSEDRVEDAKEYRAILKKALTKAKSIRV